MLVVLTGRVGIGKTTFCFQAVEALHQNGVATAGVLTSAIFEQGQKTGIKAMDLDSGETRLLARTDRDMGGPKVGPYRFDETVLAWMIERCTQALDGQTVVFVDEIGRLELNRGQGLAPLLPILAQPRIKHTVVIVREALVDPFLARIGTVPQQIWTLEPAYEARPQQCAKLIRQLCTSQID